MRLPNSYGSIINLGKGRRKPYAVRITAEMVQTGPATFKQKYKYLEYFATKAQALTFLAEYNNGHIIKEHVKYTEIPTFAEVYEMWKREAMSRKNKLSDSSMRNYSIAFDHFEPLHNFKFVNIKYQAIQECANTYNTKSKSTVNCMKFLLNNMYAYAIKNDIAEKNNNEYVVYEFSKSEEEMHTAFTLEEIKLLWSCCDKMFNVDTVLIYIYTGLRPTELLEIETENVHLEERYMVGGIKNASSINRTIPISDKIYPLVKRRYQQGRKYLVSNKFGNHYSYGVYVDSFNTIMDKLNLKHKAHDGRHTFASLMHNAKADELCIKKIMGHAANDITKDVYTHITKDSLLAEVQKLNNIV